MEDSSFGRLVAVLTSPQKTFRSIAERPTWVVALVVFVALGVVVSVLMVPHIDAEEMVRANLEQRGGEVTQEQVDQGAAFMENFKWALFVVPVVLFTPLVYLVMASLFLLFFRLGGSDLGFKTSLSTSLHGMAPWAVASLLSIPLIVTSGTLDVERVQSGSLLMSNLGFLAGEDTGAFVKSLLGSIDFFSFWTIALLGLGYRETAKVSTGMAFGTTAVLWLVWIFGKAGMAAIFA